MKDKTACFLIVPIIVAFVVSALLTSLWVMAGLPFALLWLGSRVKQGYVYDKEER